MSKKCEHLNKKKVNDKDAREAEEIYHCKDCKTIVISILPHDHVWEVLEDKALGEFIFQCKKCPMAKVIDQEDLNRDK